MRYTGVKATPEQVEALKSSLSTPYIAVTGGVEPMGALQLSHKFALENGLPEIPGYYGCDLRTGEFVQA